MRYTASVSMIGAFFTIWHIPYKKLTMFFGEMDRKESLCK